MGQVSSSDKRLKMGQPSYHAEYPPTSSPPTSFSDAYPTSSYISYGIKLTVGWQLSLLDLDANMQQELYNL